MKNSPINPDTPDRVLVAIRQIHRAIDLHSRKLIQEHGLTVPQLLVLKEALRHPGSSVGRLAERVQLSQGTVTQILTRLEQRGMLLRTRSDEDRRRVVVTVTPLGVSVLDRAPMPLHDRFLHSFDSLEEWEQTFLLSALQRVARMMGAGGMDVAPLLAPGEIREPGSTETEGEEICDAT